MKYQVQIKYTNPAHEHVSLRRRVDTINRIVEASSEDEAINRAANQQRALGFLIREAAVIKSENDEKETKKKKKIVGDDNEKTDIAVAGGVKEGFDPEPSDIAAHLVNKHGKGKVTKDHVDAYERNRDSNKGIDKEAVMKHVQKMSEEVEQTDEAVRIVGPGMMDPEKNRLAKKEKEMKDRRDLTAAAAKERRSFAREPGVKGFNSGRGGYGATSLVSPDQNLLGHYLKAVKTMKKEEVEQVDEANMRFDPEAAARPKSSDVKNFLNRDTNRRAGAASKKYIRRMTKLGGLGPNQTKKDTEAHMKAHFEEVELSETSKEGKDVMRNMRASLKSMDLRHGVDSDKREAGYKMSPAVKAAQAKSDALSKVVKRPQAGTLAAAKMKKEEVEGNGKKKARSAAEKMVKAAKGKANKINLEPTIDLTKKKEA